MLSEALAGLQLKVTVDGTPHKGDLRPGDLVRFEDHFGKPVFGDGDPETVEKLRGEDPANPSPEAQALLAKVGLGMKEMFYLAYLATRRTVDYVDYDDFLDRVEDIAIGSDDVRPGKDLSPGS